MTTPVPAPPVPPTDDGIRKLRLLGRLAVAYLLDLIAIARGDGHPLDTLLASAIIQANVQELGRRPGLQPGFAATDAAPPDELRRPVSMNALASSLELPFETVRRRVRGMVEAGFCRFVDGGVIVPAAILADPKYLADGWRAYERLRAFYYQLSDLDLLPALPPPAPGVGRGDVPVREVARLVGAYALRVMEAVGRAGDVQDGLIQLEIFRSNVAGLSTDIRVGPGFAQGDMVPDEARAPISATALAARLGFPKETVRRRVAALIARGACARRPGGLIIPGAALEGPLLRSALAANHGNLQRLFGALSQLGVLDIWDGIREDAPTA